MYAQQAASQQSSTQQSSAQQGSSGWQTMAAGADSRQATSNQALLEDAGIAQQEGEGDSMLGMVLECLPLEAAVPMAAAHIEDAGVQEWARRQDLVSVAKVAARWRPDLLEAQWPAGVGISVHGTLGGELGLGGDVEATFQVLKQDDGSFAVTSRSEFAVDVGKDTAGVSLLTSGVDPELVSGLAATLGVGVGVDFDGTATLTGTELLFAGLGAVAQPALAGLFLAGASVMDFVDDAGWINIRDHVALPDMETEVRAFGEGEARMRAGLNQVEMIPGLLGAVSDALDTLVESIRFLGDLSASHRVEVIMSAGLKALRFEESAEGLGELARSGLFGDSLDPTLMEAAADHFGRHAGVSLVVPLVALGDAQGVTVDASHASMTWEIGSEEGETAETDTLCVTLPKLADFVSAARGQAAGLDVLMNAVTLARHVELPADPAMADNAVATFLGSVAETVGGAYAIGGIDTLRLVGSLTANAETMGRLAVAGIQAPPELSAASALRDIHDALCGAATGTGGMADWLRPWAGAIADAAGSMTLEESRLKGELLVGAGMQASKAVTGGASIKARGTFGLVIDQPADEAGDLQVREALARGAFREEAAPAAEPEQAVDEGVCEQPVEEMVCEQEEGGAEQGRAPAEQTPPAQTPPKQTEQAPTTEESEQTQTVEQPPQHADTGTDSATTDTADKNGKGDDDSTGGQTRTDEASADADKNGKDSKGGTDKNGRSEREQPFQLPRALRRFQRRTDIGAPKGPGKRS